MEINQGTMLWQAFDNNNQVIDILTLKSRAPALAVGPGSNADLHLVLSGRPGFSYIIQQSSDLTSWETIATNNLAATGNGVVTNTLSSLGSARFFRAELQ